MGQAKVRKKQGLGPRNKPSKPALPRQWYAEYSAQQVNSHKAECKDPNCTTDIALRLGGARFVAMVKSGDLKTLYIAPYGTDTASDYQPVYALKLATGEEIAGSFDKDGKAVCSITGHDEGLCLTLLCHRKGIMLAIHQDAPDTVSVLCADPECGNALKGDGLLTRRMKLANRPTTEYPNTFCDYHGVQPIYVACNHVLAGAEPMILNRPETDWHGSVFCGDECLDIFRQECKDISEGKAVPSCSNHNICAAHLDAILGGKLEQFHQQADANSPQAVTA